MQEQEHGRNEAATPFKLEEARKKGSVNKSAEVITAAVVAALLLYFWMWGKNSVDSVLLQSESIFSQAGTLSFEPSQLYRWLTSQFLNTLTVLAPLFAFLMIIGIVSNIFQTGLIFSFVPIKPDFDRINPAAGLKRLFSWRMLFELIKGVLKLVLFGCILYYSLVGQESNFLSLIRTDPKLMGSQIVNLSLLLSFRVLMALAAIALIDYLFSSRDFARKMRMSRREIKEEVKRREGDPRVRSRIRELQREALKRSKSVGRVADASVLITNPTRIAVALRYAPEEHNAPQVIAKGAGDLAKNMRLIAQQNSIPIVENKKLARELFHQTPIDHLIPEQLFSEVAKIFLWLKTMKQKNKDIEVLQ